MTNARPVCFSCKRFYDQESGKVISEVVSDAKPGEKLCGACIQRIENQERAEAEDRERHLWETH
jgi:hypothetical protein